MEQEPTPIIELFGLVAFLGSGTFLLGAIFQAYFLWKKNKSIWTSLAIIITTRILTIPITFFLWAFLQLSLSTWFIFFVPALLPEFIFSPLILKLFGVGLMDRKKPVHNSG